MVNGERDPILNIFTYATMPPPEDLMAIYCDLTISRSAYVEDFY